MRRRQFLGSVGAFCLTAGAAGQLFSFDDDSLNWRQDIINSVPRGRENRAPVVTDVCLRPGGNQLAFVGDNHQISIYDLNQKQFERHLARHNDWVRCVGYSPDGQMLASAGNDRNLMLWNVDDWEAMPVVKRQSSAIIATAFSPDSNRLAIVGFDHRLRVYDLLSGEIVHELTCHCPDNHAVAFSQNGEWIAAGGRSGVIRIWQSQSGKQLHEFPAHRRRIRSMQFDKQGNVISCGDDQIVRITPAADPGQSRTMPRHPAKLYAVALLPDQMLATAGSDNQIHIWKLNDNSKVGTLNGHTGTISCLDVDEKRIVSGSYDTQIRVWHIQTDFVAKLPDDPSAGGGWNQKIK